MRSRVSGLVLVLVLVPFAGGVAQTSPSDNRAATALRASHIGALTPLMTPSMVRRQLEGAQLAIRYGLHEQTGRRTHGIAASALFSVGLASSVSLTAGVSDGDCATCSPALLLGIGGDMRLYESGDASTGALFNVSVSGDFGYAQVKPGSGSAIALGIGTPVTVSLPAGGPEGMHIVPFLTPTFGVGQYDEGCVGACENSGTRWVLGGGIGLWNPLTTVSASLGVNQVLIAGAKPVYGINVVFGGR